MLLPFRSVHYKNDLDTFACRVSVIKKNFTYYFLPCDKPEAGHSVCNNTTQNLLPPTSSSTTLKCAAAFIMQHLPPEVIMRPFSSVNISKTGKRSISVQYIFRITGLSSCVLTVFFFQLSCIQSTYPL